MKNLKKMLASLVVVAMMASMALVPAFAATNSYEKEAVQLNKVGLYMGISETEFVPDLETLLDRQTGVVMLLRMFGQEDEAKLLTDEQANSMLAKFTDAGTIADWAKKQVAYAVDKGVVKGYAEDSTFRPSAGLNGKAYSSLMLQQLGYDGEFDYNQAATKLAQVGGLNASQAALFNSDTQLNKDALVGISYGALQAKNKADGKKLVKVLLENGTIKEADLKEAEIPYAEVTSVAAIADVTVDIGAEAKLPATVTATFDNGTTADVAVTWPTVDTSKDGEQTITGTIANTAITASVKVIVVPAELKVTGAASGNRKELILNFNRPVADADKAKDKANYKVKKYTVQNADLSEDKMTVTLLIEQTIAQQADVDVTIDEKVGFKEDVELTIKNIKDTNTPSVVSVDAVGNTLIKVTFSEPVQNAKSISFYTIDGKSIAASNTTVSNNGKVVSITLKNPLTADTHKLVVKDKVVDYAGFSIEDNETEFTVVEDKEAPTGIVESATQTKVVITFSEPVKKPDIDDVDTNTSAEIVEDETKLDDDDITYTIVFDLEDPLPTAGGKLTIKNLSDYSGNKTDFTILIEPKYDMTRPEYVSYTIDDDQKQIIVEFDEDVKLGEDEEFKLVDADKDEVSLATPEYKLDDNKKPVKNKIVLKRSDKKVFAAEKHELTISGVEDNTPLGNEIAKITVTIDVDDKEAPEVEAVVYNDDPKVNALYVRFNEDLDEDSATEFSNYAVDYENKDGKSKTVTLKKDIVDIELLSDNRTVFIEFNGDGDDFINVGKISRLQIDSVEDTAGNKMSIDVVTSFDAYDPNDAPQVTGAKVTGEETIVLTLNDVINEKTLSVDDFIITAVKGSEEIEIDAYDAEFNKDDKEIKLSMSKDLTMAGKYVKDGKVYDLYLTMVKAADVETVNAFQMKLELLGSEIEIKDAYDPTAESVVSAVYKDNTVVTIELNEELDYENGDLLSTAELQQFVVKADGKAVSKEIKYVAPIASVDDKKTKDLDESKARFVITIGGKDYSGKTVDVSFNAVDGSTVADSAGNVLKDFEFKGKKVTK